jgi:hypothetical protein
MIVIYKCNHAESWKYESSGIWWCIVISVYFEWSHCPQLGAAVGTDFFFKQGVSIVFECAINTAYRHKTLWIIYHQRHILALWAEYTIVVLTCSIAIHSSYHNCVFILNVAYKAKTYRWYKLFIKLCVDLFVISLLVGVDCLSVRVKTQKLLQMSAATHPTSQCHILEDWNLQQHISHCL